MRFNGLEDAEIKLGHIRDGNHLTEMVKDGLLQKNQAKKLRKELTEREKIRSLIRQNMPW